MGQSTLHILQALHRLRLQIKRALTKRKVLPLGKAPT